MATLPTNRTTSNTAAEHVSDHNTLHGLWNVLTTAGDLIVATAAQVYDRLAIGTDGQVLTVDTSLAKKLKWATPSGTSVVRHKFAKRTSGTITLTAATFAALDTGTDLVLAASVGDSIEVALGGLFGNEAVSIVLDVATMVAGSAVNWFATDGTSSGYGIWYKNTVANNEAISGSIIRTLVSGDISGGNVTLRAFGRRDTSNATVLSSTAIPLHFWAKNLGPVAT